jgi:hypothetical protein
MPSWAGCCAAVQSCYEHRLKPIGSTVLLSSATINHGFHELKYGHKLRYAHIVSVNYQP